MNREWARVGGRKNERIVRAVHGIALSRIKDCPNHCVIGNYFFKVRSTIEGETSQPWGVSSIRQSVKDNPAPDGARLANSGRWRGERSRAAITEQIKPHWEGEAPRRAAITPAMFNRLGRSHLFTLGNSFRLFRADRLSRLCC